jgi:hypothetical protein
VIVTDESIVQCISEVRLAIDDRQQAIVKTVPRRGYRFAAAVSLIVTLLDPKEHRHNPTGTMSARSRAVGALCFSAIGSCWRRRPPKANRAAIEALAGRAWQHQTAVQFVRFGFSTVQHRRAPRIMTIFRRIDRRRGATVILAHSLS